MVIEVVGAECVVGDMEVEFVVVHVSAHVHILTKSASSTKTGSLHLYLLWSGNGLVGFRSLGLRNDMPGVMCGVWWTSASTQVPDIGVSRVGLDTLGLGSLALASGYFLS